MCGGQYLDTSNEAEDVDAEYLTALHSLKTGALLQAACLMGVIGAGADSEKKKAAADFALNLGLAFQIRDDMLDTMGDAATLGQDIGSDAANGKTTFVTLYGLEGCEKLIADYTSRALSALESAFPDESFLRTLALELAGREK